MDDRPKPSRAVSVQTDGVRTPVATARLSELARGVLAAIRVKHAMLSITLVSARAIAILNRRHLGHAGPTDVLTFAFGENPQGVVVADVYICVPVARSQARAHGVGVREEMARLVVHGTLHACGWSHPDGDERLASPMWKRQERLLQRLWITPAQRA
ncbi:MAG: rRNA maturation RNase YbeY [Gemmatimonas sp.]